VAGAGALVAAQPFATLDPTTRRLTLPGGRRVTLSDTVGFVRKLPHDLVEAFKSTLDEVSRADLVLHVANAAAPDVGEQISAVREVLDEIGAGLIPEVLVLNKWDLLADEHERERLLRRYTGAVPVTAVTGEGTEALAERVSEALPRPPVEVTLLVPYDKPEVVPLLYRRAEVLSTEDRDDGTLVRARVGEAELSVVEPFLVRPARRGVRSS